jgi:hypothetical protein
MTDVDAWIETTAYHEEGRTLWLVRIGGQILTVGEVIDDPAGVIAFERASVAARTNFPGISFNWKHHTVKTTVQSQEQARRTG